MIPPGGVAPAVTLATTFGPAAILGLLSVMVALGVVLASLIAERRWLASWKRTMSVPPAEVSSVRVAHYARPQTA
jgi:hypothetical protein